jgi:hypothetical protein
MSRLWRNRGRAIDASRLAGSPREPLVNRHGRGRTLAPARLGMHAQLSRSCEDPEDPDAEPAEHARRSASTALDWSGQHNQTSPCRIPRRAREAPIDDLQAQPAPAREKHFHAYGEPRRILRSFDEPIASMSEWVSSSTNQSWSRRPESPNPSLACSRRMSASETPPNSWARPAWAHSRRSWLLASNVRLLADTGHTGSGHEGRLWAEPSGSPAAVKQPPFGAVSGPSGGVLAGRRARTAARYREHGVA